MRFNLQRYINKGLTGKNKKTKRKGPGVDSLGLSSFLILVKL
jgi:hypothetical protein